MQTDAMRKSGLRCAWALLLALALAVVACMSAPRVALAGDALPDCGVGVHTNIDQSRTELLIWCDTSGAMYDHDGNTPTQPWIADSSTISTVIIEEGVTHLGAWSFDSMPVLQTVVLPSTLTSIGDGAINACGALSDILYLGTVDQWMLVAGRDKLPSGSKVTCCNQGSCTLSLETWSTGSFAYSSNAIALQTTLDTIAMFGRINATYDDVASHYDVNSSGANDVALTASGVVAHDGSDLLGYKVTLGLMPREYDDAALLYHEFYNHEFYNQVIIDFGKSPKIVPMHRLYNQWTGEHFYTGSTKERDDLVKIGWTYENVGWYAPAWSAIPVYRLYNQYTSDHHYTTSADERNQLVSYGWTDEGIGWYSASSIGLPVYREFNPYAQIGTHNYTTDEAEHNYLGTIGWLLEGIAWYGLYVG